MSGVYKRGGPSRSCPEPHSSRLSHRAAPVEWGEGSSGHRVPPHVLLPVQVLAPGFSGGALSPEELLCLPTVPNSGV